MIFVRVLLFIALILVPRFLGVGPEHLDWLMLGIAIGVVYEMLDQFLGSLHED